MDIGLWGENIDVDEDTRDILEVVVSDIIKSSPQYSTFHVCCTPGMDVYIADQIAEAGKQIILHVPYDKEMYLNRVHPSWHGYIEKLFKKCDKVVEWVEYSKYSNYNRSHAFMMQIEGFLSCIDELYTLYLEESKESKRRTRYMLDTVDNYLRDPETKLKKIIKLGIKGEEDEDYGGF